MFSRRWTEFCSFLWRAPKFVVVVFLALVGIVSFAMLSNSRYDGWASSCLGYKPPKDWIMVMNKTFLEKEELAEFFVRRYAQIRTDFPPIPSFFRKKRRWNDPIIIFSRSGEMFWPQLSFDSDLSWVASCPTPCRMTYNVEDRASAHIILHHLQVDRKYPLLPHQRLALLTLEPMREPISLDDFKGVDILISYKQMSDVVVNYQYAIGSFVTPFLNATQAFSALNVTNRYPLDDKRTDALAAMFISNCNDKLRLDYLEELSRYIPIHSYGNCLKTPGFNFPRSPQMKVMLQSKYKFALAFENNRLDDYMTEKFYEALISDSVGVYWGAPNVEKYFPNNQIPFVDASKFHPRGLADHLLYLARNRSEYLKYFDWRFAPVSENFLDLKTYDFENRGSTSFLCRVCDFYNTHYESAE